MRRELALKAMISCPLCCCIRGHGAAESMKFPAYSLLAGNFGASETGSLVTAPSSGESDANSRRRSGANTAGCRAAAAWFPSGPFDIGTCRGSLRIRRHRGPRSISGLAVLDSAPNEGQTMSDDRDGSRQSAQTTKQRRKGTSPLAWAGDDAAAPARRNGLGPWTDRRGSWPPAK
jgi:hypothetical protein